MSESRDLRASRRERVIDFAKKLSKEHRVPMSCILGFSREQEVVRVRHLLWRQLRETGWTLQAIADAIGVDHTTVLHALKPKGDHLRLLPKPLAKCPPPRAYPEHWDMVELRREGLRWRVVGQLEGRLVEMRLTTSALRDLVEQANKLMERDADDVE